MKQIYVLLNYAITGITALMYILLLGSLFTELRYKSLAISIGIPFLGVIVCSVLRAVINAPRPYEVSNIGNLLNKKTTGKSFPSRHVFCVFVIATTVFKFFPVFGGFLFVLGIILCFVRVKTKVHFLRDVICGAALGVAIGSAVFFF